ncbi:MAG: dihydrodipicolinate synthase family protein [Thermodesulfobacteriota bacterium]|nr:dihydrodipicolinate synthase family protein [Thermodesulfobacteriota bacterium]
MEISVAPRGLIVELITPLKDDGSIDGHGLERLVERVVPFAQALLLASPHTGEGKNLTSFQRLELLEKALVSTGRRKIPVLIWVSQDTEGKTRDTILTLKSGLERQSYTGQVLWVDTPLYYHSNRKLPALYHDLCSMVGGPIMLHNDPGLIEGLDVPLKRHNIRTGILKELIHLNNIVGLIFSGSLDRVHNFQEVCRRRPDFRIYDEDETHFLDHPSMSGVVSVGANLAPKAWQKITQSCLHFSAGQKNYPDHRQQIWELERYLRTLKDIYQQKPVTIVKEILADMGVIETPTCTFPVEGVKESKREAEELMALNGDYT